MQVWLEPVALPRDRAAVTDFLVAHEWPYHGVPRLTAGSVDSVVVDSDSVSSWWVVVAGERAGLVRALDLDDVAAGDGSPLFDLRVGEPARGRGVGTAAVALLTSELFGRFPTLHRIEAATRDDNVAMQRVLERCGYRREGRLRESWRRPDGGRADTLVYGILRTDPRPDPRPD